MEIVNSVFKLHICYMYSQHIVIHILQNKCQTREIL